MNLNIRDISLAEWRSSTSISIGSGLATQRKVEQKFLGLLVYKCLVRCGCCIDSPVGKLSAVCYAIPVIYYELSTATTLIYYIVFKSRRGCTLRFCTNSKLYY